MEHCSSLIIRVKNNLFFDSDPQNLFAIVAHMLVNTILWMFIKHKIKWNFNVILFLLRLRFKAIFDEVIGNLVWEKGTLRQ